MIGFGVTAQSAGAIVIDADGSVSGTNLIQQQGNVYRLTGDIYDMSITVCCNNIVLDGQGYLLQGAGGWGTPGVAGVESTAAIHLTCSNVTIQNFKSRAGKQVSQAPTAETESLTTTLPELKMPLQSTPETT